MLRLISRRSHRCARLCLLRLEDRLAPANWTVNTLLDNDGSGSGNSGTLRYCIAQANVNPGDDTIGFAVNGTIVLANGQLTLSDTTGQTTINGPGANLLTIDGNFASRVFGIDTSVTASMAGVTMTHGTVSAGRGGGINNDGTLTVSNCIISGNTAVNGGNADGGGGIFNLYDTVAVANCTISANNGSGIVNLGTLTATNSTIIGNSGVGRAAGIRNIGTLTVANCDISANNGCGINNGNDIYATVTVTNSTISGNSAMYGGGIYNFDGILMITDSTISGNSTGGVGGGIRSQGNYAVTVTNSTISGNNANVGGGIYVGSGLLNATNTIIAGNHAPTSADLYGSLTTNDHNLLNMSAAAAGLGTLGNYGGPTQTIPLLPGSPAINGGTSNGAPATDQRGLPRFGQVDIGAFEVQSAPVVVSTMVNDGTAQRSRVTSLTVTFNYVLSFAGQVASAFTLTRTGGGALNFAANANIVNGVTVVTINNFTGNETQFGSLADGRYTLTALASQISANGQPLDGNSDGLGGDDFHFGDAQGFFRFYGDMNGDRRVDITDFGFFSLAFLQTPNYNPALDFNGDGRIDIADFGQFSARFFTTLP